MLFHLGERAAIEPLFCEMFSASTKSEYLHVIVTLKKKPMLLLKSIRFGLILICEQIGQ